MSETSIAETSVNKRPVGSGPRPPESDVIYFNLLMLFILAAFTTVIAYTPASGAPEMFLALSCLILNLVVGYNAGTWTALLLSVAFTFAYGSYVIFTAGNPGAADVRLTHILWMLFFPIGAALSGRYAQIAARLRGGMENGRTLEKLVAIDEKTGFYKEQEFFKQLGEEFVRAKRFKTPLSILLIRINSFAEFALIYGEADIAGIIRTVSEYLSKNLRFCDTKFLIAEDSLGVILPETGEAGAKAVLEKLRPALGQITNVTRPGLKKAAYVVPGISFAGMIHERDRSAMEIFERARAELDGGMD